MGTTLLKISVLVALTAVVSGCEQETPFPTNDELTQLRGMYRLRTPPRDPTNALADDPRAVTLGKRLFNDPLLSSCGTVSCATCHPAPGYADSKAFSHGCGGETRRHVPTLLNVAFSPWLMWDGRADSMWAQAGMPLTDPVEMAGTPALFRQRLTEDYRPEYLELFGAAPEEEADDDRLEANLGKLLHAYQRTLIRVDSPFDEQLLAYLAAVEKEEHASLPLHFQLKTFVREGQCALCHKGPMLTDDDYHNIRLGTEGGTPPADPGRLTGLDTVLASPLNGAGAYSDSKTDGQRKLNAAQNQDRSLWDGAMKTPTLRNVELTAPYMHDGRFATLEEVIEFYDKGGDPDGTFYGTPAETIVPLDLTEEQKAALVELLKAMTGTDAP